MKYFKATQPVPGKGNALIFYEVNDDERIERQLTVIPQTGEVEQVPDPVVKKLYRPELLTPATAQEFDNHWKDAGA